MCKECIDTMYNTYLSQCNDAKSAVRQMCRKLDLFWSDTVYESVERKSTTKTMMTQYIAKINTVSYAGKSYDDTLSNEGALWSFAANDIVNSVAASSITESPTESENDDVVDVPDEVKEFWGNGYSPDMYLELEQRRAYYMSKLPNGELDIGSEVLIRQICNLEVTIAKDSAAGKSIDKSVNSLNTLLGSLNLKPTQRKNDDLEAELSSTPMGVWLYRFENKRPLPETEDSDYIKKYIFTWMGHLCKMLGIKNGYTRLYEEEVNRLRVAKPEYEDEDDETLLSDSYTEATKEMHNG